jgi:hypothetical protein
MTTWMPSGYFAVLALKLKLELTRVRVAAADAKHDILLPLFPGYYSCCHYRFVL